MSELRNPAEFFASLRDSKLFGDELSVSVVAGLNALLSAAEAADWNTSWTAYGLATAFRETASTMRPIREYGSDAYLSKYDTGSLAVALGNTEPGDGVKFCGRGYVQVTGRRNYAKAEQELGIAFTSSPDLALDPVFAAEIMTRGMQEGWFTGLRLNERLFVDVETLDNFVKARGIINGTDHADEIGNNAIIFQAALIKGEWT